MGRLTLGRGNAVHTGCVLGDHPQHLGYKGEPTETVVGDFNTFREYCTVHRAMPRVEGGAGAGVTSIGSHNFLMTNAHVAHDCRVGDHCILASGAVVGGHAIVADRAFLSGNSAVHQNCRVGRLALVGGTAAISQDLPPFWVIQGGINVLHGVNLVGMRRAGVPADEIQAVRKAYKLLNRSGLTIPEALKQMEAESGGLSAVRELIDFIRASRRGIVVGRPQPGD